MKLDTGQALPVPQLSPDFGGYFGSIVRQIADKFRGDSDGIVIDKHFKNHAVLHFQDLPHGAITLQGTDQKTAPTQAIELPVNPAEDSLWQKKRRNILSGDLADEKSERALEHALNLISQSIELERYVDTMAHPQKYLQPKDRILDPYYRGGLRAVTINEHSRHVVYSDEDNTLEFPYEVFSDFFSLTDTVIYGLAQALHRTKSVGSDYSITSSRRAAHEETFNRLTKIKEYLEEHRAPEELKSYWFVAVDKHIAARLFRAKREALISALTKVKDYAYTSFTHESESSGEFTTSTEQLRDIFSRITYLPHALGSDSLLPHHDMGITVDSTGNPRNFISSEDIDIEVDDEGIVNIIHKRELPRVEYEVSMGHTIALCDEAIERIDSAQRILALDIQEGGIHTFETAKKLVSEVANSWGMYCEKTACYARLFNVDSDDIKLAL